MLLNCLCCIFHSFEAGIANAISSFKWRKMIVFFENIHILNRIILLSELLYYLFQRHIIWLNICMKPYIYGRSRTRVNSEWIIRTWHRLRDFLFIFHCINALCLIDCWWTLLSIVAAGGLHNIRSRFTNMTFRTRLHKDYRYHQSQSITRSKHT